ncbi:MAG TPA: S4 domain-containing protein [Gemmatimonadales bacterium]|nr:S4 domain-containing protein [Gemmatimonadales bacterium]
MREETPAGKVRVDKWLWAARFYKTRSLAAAAIDGGKVTVNGDRARRSRLLGTGDIVTVRIVQDEWTLVVKELSERRGPAAEARKLYEETDDSRRERERQAESRRLTAPVFHFTEGKPSKKDRRSLRRLKGS